MALLFAILLAGGQAALPMSRDEVPYDPNVAVCGIRQSSPAALVEQVMALPGFVEVQRTDKWVAKSNGSSTWTVATRGTDAFPTVVCRTIANNPINGASIQTQIVCGASQQVCDRVRDDFQTLDERTRRELLGQ